MSYNPVIIPVLCAACVAHAVSVTQEQEDGAGIADNIFSTVSSNHLAVAGVLSMLVFLLLVVFVVPGCMDCMNGEVSSDSHPACASTAPKWGGATGYTSSSRSDQNPQLITGELTNPANNQSGHLSYTLTPFQVPEQSGFSGYQPVGGTGRDAGGPVSYGATERGVGMAGGDRPIHYNPMEHEDPPPPYSEATWRT